VPVGVEYPASLSTVDWIEAVGFILRLKTQVFSSNLYKRSRQHYTTNATPPPASQEDGETDCLAQP